MILIDGARGEGGGQILRSSIALSLLTGEPFRIERIRAGRDRPGLMRQHLAALRAASEVSKGARIEGDRIGSSELSFYPGSTRAGDYHFTVGTAGSTSLVLQTVLPALMLASGDSRITLEGGTHNPMAPPFDFLEKVFLPLVRRSGPVVTADLERAGFYPAGGGRLTVSIRSAVSLSGLELVERGPIQKRRITARVAALPRSIAVREVAAARRRLGWDESQFETRIETVTPAAGPGNVLLIELESAGMTEMFTGFGEKGRKAESVAEATAAEADAYLDAGVPVGPYLADQLLILMALAGQGAMRTQPPTPHTTTQLEVIGRFLDVGIRSHPVSSRVWEFDIG